MTTFSDLNLDARVLKAIADTGYETPTPIQEQAIPHALEGRDVLGIAQTGTGKTASFVLPMLTHLAKGRARARMPRSLVLAPTRELAAQVAENFEAYAKHMKLSMALLIGGVSFKDQDKLIDRGVDVLIATPGRLLDHFERGKLMLTGVQIMVVDEADRMLDMGFIPDIERIFKLTPFTRQTLFFSATMAPEITRITTEFLSNPVRVEVARQATTSETIDQHVCKHKPARRDTADKEKREVLRRLITAEGEALTNGIIFCNRKRDVDIVAKSLAKHGFDAAAIHGDLDQSVRTRTLDGFRDGSLRLLVASDVAARGLDIPSVSHVFNYDVPIHSEDYVHRIGRTGRAGRSGKAISICLPADEKYLEKVEELVKKQIPVIASPLAGDRTAKAKAATAGIEEAATGRADRRDTAPKDRRERGRDRDRDRRGRGRPQRDDKPVVGMGDHVPAFLVRDLRLKKADTPSDEAETAEAPAPEDMTADAPDKTQAKPKRKTQPRKPRAKTEAAAMTEAAAPSVPDTPVEAQPQTDAPEPPAKPARKPRTRSSAAQVIDGLGPDTAERRAS